ncbi:MAG: orotidine-5'-phosphate decarboxylase [Deltaproteobacteria bacterium]|nr:orotidine-5'-phosphate decarboxylase [Deltaproteobacteria bacterium]
MNKAKEKLILALDIDNTSKAIELIELLKDYIGIFKIGKQLFTRLGPEIIRIIQKKGGKVFLDLKFFDIPNTVKKAVKEATFHKVSMFTIHAMGGRKMIKEAVKSCIDSANMLKIPRPLVLAVTLLTSFDEKGIHEIGISGSIEENVLKLARLSMEAGADGVIASPKEIKLIRKECGDKFLIVTPGIRPSSINKDDQVRTMTPSEAIKEGADYIVVGRPILLAEDPVEEAKKIINNVKDSF